MNTKTKTLYMLLVLVTVISMLVSCAQSTPTAGPTSGPTSGPTADPAEKTLQEYTDVMKVDCAFYVGTAAPPDLMNNLTVKYIRDTLKIDISGSIFLAGENAAEKMALMVASKTMPDVINFWKDPIMDELVKQFADAGMLLETEPLFKYIPTITPNYTKIVLDINRNPTDGKIYSVPSWAVNPDNKAVSYTIEPNLDLVVRRDLLDTVGKPLPKTMEDFYQLLVAFKELPDVNGKKMIPLQPLMGFSDFEMLVGAGFGIWKHRKDMNEAEKRLVNMYEVPEYVEFLKYAAKLYREGLVDPEMFVTTYEKCYERVGEGRVGVYIEWPNNIDVNNAAIQKNIPSAKYEAISVPRLDGLGTTDYWHTATLGACTTIVNKNFPDPVRLMKFFDWQFTTEGWATVALGAPSKTEGAWYMEGGDYFFNKPVYDELVKIDPSYSNKIGAWVYFMVGQLVYLPEDIGLKYEGGTDPDRLLAKERNIDDVYMDQEYELWQAIPMGPIEKEKGTAITQIFTNMTQSIVMESKTDAEVVTAYNTMMDEAKSAGLIEMLKEQYQLIKDFQATQK
jgi:ABC-type glycerol-3-phosphate transport system substrate-binding protein